jgi:copper chaperone CopZ
VECVDAAACLSAIARLIPNLPGVEVENYTVKNSTRWFWIIENPTKAHNNYARDKRAIREMLQSHSEANK